MESTMSLSIGTRRKAKNIRYTLAIGDDMESEFSLDENLDWLRQYHAFANRANSYLVEGQESYPIRVWECSNEKNANNINALYTLVWQVSDEQ